MKLMKHYANNSLSTCHLILHFMLEEFSQGVLQTLPDLPLFMGQTQAEHMMDIIAGVAVFQQPRMQSGQEPHFSSWHATNQCSSLIS